LWISFAVFCLLVASLVLTARWYVATATEEHTANLTVVRGTVLVQESRRTDWVAAANGQVLEEGFRVRTDETSQALLTLFEGSVVNLFPGTELTITALRSRRFDPQSYSLALSFGRGKMRVEVADSSASSRDFLIYLPPTGATARLGHGSYSFDSDGAYTEVKVRDRGLALLRALNQQVEVRPRQRSQLLPGQAPRTPVPAARQFIINGDFRDGLKHWTWGNRDVFPKSPPGTVSIIKTELGNAVRFHRTNSNAAHAETYIRQEIDQDVSDFRYLTLSLQLKLVYQSLSGGGYLGSEYPVLVKVYYRSERGDNILVYGFYYQNKAGNLTTNGTLLPQKEWVSYTVPQNLMSVDPAPLRILALEVTASGHDYESLVKEVGLEGE
jgi:hypothetical protein